MDPAGPGFEKAPRNEKLNSTDAKYVQCIYTDGNTWGTRIEYGDAHAHFLMHDGLNQPGCENKPAICDHSLAHEYFKESMNKNSVFEGTYCGAENNQHRTDWIGIHSKGENGTFCVKVNRASPYAKGHILAN